MTRQRAASLPIRISASPEDSRRPIRSCPCFHRCRRIQPWNLTPGRCRSTMTCSRRSRPSPIFHRVSIPRPPLRLPARMKCPPGRPRGSRSMPWLWLGCAFDARSRAGHRRTQGPSVRRALVRTPFGPAAAVGTGGWNCGEGSRRVAKACVHVRIHPVRAPGRRDLRDHRRLSHSGRVWYHPRSPFLFRGRRQTLSRPAEGGVPVETATPPPTRTCSSGAGCAAPASPRTLVCRGDGLCLIRKTERANR